MAKKKAATNGAASAPAPTTKAPAKKAPKKAAAKKPAAKPVAAKEKVAKAPAAPAISTEQIGDAAGHVWGALADQGPLTLAALKQACPVSAELVLAAVGWLAREDKLAFETFGRTMKVSVR
ncbi:hypothetical protein Pla175_08740 [Pirellulimonas nuda]|uniref:Winged helix-turn-helix domain-containing protein n=1 Tax=Pirellulimonas nuda TaxID=2528009 RepID=A0A518D7R2_9BACT|nr:winged helix-turn-helix domain-containing protein [Pirellulimonas nuda]QDU87512.1 hypothetical protein Pla175_08740 [Pirellulimonas nuda]